MGSVCPDVTLDSCTFRVECQLAKGLDIWSTDMQETICVQRQEKYLIPLYIRVFREFIYIIYLLQRLF